MSGSSPREELIINTDRNQELSVGSEAAKDACTHHAIVNTRAVM